MDMTHGSNVLGSVQDIRTMGDFLHDRGIYFIIDRAQISGHVPINLRGLPVDGYVFTSHKGLSGSRALGGFTCGILNRSLPSGSEGQA
ncbi:MAG: aminotransferase class V-fold PLP-dependent enzyme [Methanomicrobiales archaeon]|nr:aminotransferase class V-fold PLP-dependent enzyme [Methanomicrobiales archaeon]